MSEYNLCFCDLCNPEYLMPNEKETTLLISEDGNLAVINRGYVFATAKQAIKKHGWEERDFGHICQTCVREEAYQNQMDQESGAEVVIGLPENQTIDKTDDS